MKIRERIFGRIFARIPEKMCNEILEKSSEEFLEEFAEKNPGGIIGIISCGGFSRKKIQKIVQ